jgi:hypothetical protein
MPASLLVASHESIIISNVGIEKLALGKSLFHGDKYVFRHVQVGIPPTRLELDHEFTSLGHVVEPADDRGWHGCILIGRHFAEDWPKRRLSPVGLLDNCATLDEKLPKDGAMASGFVSAIAPDGEVGLMR